MYYSMHWGIIPSQKHPLFLPRLLLNLCKPHFLKIRFFSEPPEDKNF